MPNLDYNKDVPGWKTITTVGVIFAAIVGVILWTVAKVETPNTEDVRRIKSSSDQTIMPSVAPVIPIYPKSQPEYSPPMGQGSSRAREK